MAKKMKAGWFCQTFYNLSNYVMSKSFNLSIRTPKELPVYNKFIITITLYDPL